MASATTYAAGSPIQQANYYYDAIGRRILKKVVNNINSSLSFTRAYVYDKNEILMEYDGDGNLLAHYTNSILQTDDVLAANVQQNGVPVLAASTGNYFYLKDQEGSVIEVTDSSGSDLQHYTYSSYGQILSIAGNAVSTSRTFIGREYDSETGLYFYRARTYDPRLGRFLQKDPTGFKGGDINLYRYVGNNPITLVDPTGKYGGFFTLGLNTTQGPLSGQAGGTVAFGSELDGMALSGSAGVGYTYTSLGFSVSAGYTAGFFTGDVSNFNSAPSSSWSVNSPYGGIAINVYSNGDFAVGYSNAAFGASASYSDPSTGASYTDSYMAYNSASTGSSYFDSGYSFGGDSFGSSSDSGLSLGVDTSFAEDYGGE